MHELFKGIAQRLGGVYSRLGQHEPVDLDDCRRRSPLTILVQDHARFGELRGDADARGVHVIRDPRDVLVSAANYHGWSHEAWLHRLRADLGDRSYQGALCTLDFAGSVCFEMRHSGGRAIRDMMGFAGGQLFTDIRLEDLIQATTSDSWAWFSGLGFNDNELAVCSEIFAATRLRPGQSASNGLRRHIQNPDCFQWRYLYDPALLASFRERFADAAERLGYLPSCDDQLIDDSVRRDTYLAKFHGNRGQMDEAWRLVRAGLAKHPGEPRLVAVERLLANGYGAPGKI